MGCGADELIDLLMRCVLDPGERIIDCPPTFTMYAFDAAVNGAEVITVPRLSGFRIDATGECSFPSNAHSAAVIHFGSDGLRVCAGQRPDLACWQGKPSATSVPAAITEAVKVHRPKMVFLTSPNNPDGSVIAEDDLLAMLKLPVLVVLDEAYIEFSEEPSRLRWVLDHPNLVIFRTFSKSAGLAGLRVGYGESLDPASTSL